MFFTFAWYVIIREFFITPERRAKDDALVADFMHEVVIPKVSEYDHKGRKRTTLERLDALFGIFAILGLLITGVWILLHL